MRQASDLIIEELKADPEFRRNFLDSAIEEVETGSIPLAVTMLRHIAKSLLPLIVVLTAGTAQAFPAYVTKVHDGDTVTLDSSGGRETCRVSGIDAPEESWPGRWSTQPYADQSRDYLASLIQGRIVEVENTGQRSYSRNVCTIFSGGTNVNEQMVREGYAWSATQFEPTGERDPLMPVLELEAREHHRGLWAQPAIAPWDWRHENMK